MDNNSGNHCPCSLTSTALSAAAASRYLEPLFPQGGGRSGEDSTDRGRRSSSILIAHSTFNNRVTRRQLCKVAEYKTSYSKMDSYWSAKGSNL